MLGAQDLLAEFGLGTVRGVQPHAYVAGDQVQDMMPWAVLAWKQIHQGHFPLWNPYNGFGLPLFGNFQSAAMSVPALVSYLMPEHLVYTIQLYVKLLIAGTGVLWLCRRLGLLWVPSATAATAFMLSGSLTAWLGWPMSGTMGWLGWLSGCVVLIVRGERRTLPMVGLAVSVAFLMYAGHPETFVIVMICIGIIAFGLMIGDRVAGAGRPAGRSLLALGGGVAGGLALAAPLLLPGIQLVQRSNRTGVLDYNQSWRAAAGLLFSTYNGMPIHGMGYFGAQNFYETSVYVGVIVAILAGVALVARRRDPFTWSLVAVGSLCLLLTYSTGVTHVLLRIPTVKNLQWTRANTAIDFALAVLAGLGLQALLERGTAREVRRTFAAMTAAIGFIVVYLWIRHGGAHLPQDYTRIRTRSFIWPTVELGAAVIVAVWLFVSARNRRASHAARSWRFLGPGLLLFGVESAFLITATPGIWASSHLFFPPTPAESQLIAAVGNRRVGFGSCPSIYDQPPLGILAEANDVYGVSEVSAYDGIVPKSYFQAYYSFRHQVMPAYTGFGGWCPSMDSAAIARHFGVSFILTEPSQPRPRGASLIRVIGGENLYRVPGGGVVTVQPEGSPPDEPTARVPVVSSGDSSTMRVVLDDAVPSTVYLHITDFPGWHASLDGRSIALRAWGGTMLEASVPAGRHVLTVGYVPAGFRQGILVAVVAALALLALVGWSGKEALTRRREQEGRPPPSGSPAEEPAPLSG